MGRKFVKGLTQWGLGFIVALSVFSCGPGFNAYNQYSEHSPVPPFDEPPNPPPSLQEDIQEALKTPLLWSNTQFPERENWSFVALLQVGEHFASLDAAVDTHRFCPTYSQLQRFQKINFWGQLIAGISFFESSWNPRTRFQESTMGIDPVTQMPVFSEGLLQLSYQDIRWATWCPFDWNKDRHLPPDSLEKTILNPANNLRCGIGILARQIRRTQRIVLSRGAYWAVIKEDSRFQKIDRIAEMVQKTPFCAQSFK